MKIISVNLNGIRAAGRKGFFDWLASQQADVVCLQETKAQVAVLADDIYRPEGYHCYFSDAVKKGYSGVGLYIKQQPDRVVHTLGFDIADTEGRYVQVDVGRYSFVSLYLPSGSNEERQRYKFEFMDAYAPILQSQIASGRHVVICGDWNIVHKEIDIKNWKSNQKSSGCLPEERAWLDGLFTEQGWVDAFRAVNQEPHQYTWWSNRGRARENNVGWRIDYQIVSPSLRDKIRSVSIYKDSWFSDHAPLLMDYDLTWEGVCASK